MPAAAMAAAATAVGAEETRRVEGAETAETVHRRVRRGAEIAKGDAGALRAAGWRPQAAATGIASIF